MRKKFKKLTGNRLREICELDWGRHDKNCAQKEKRIQEMQFKKKLDRINTWHLIAKYRQHQ